MEYISATLHNFIISFSIGFSCRLTEHRISAQQKALTVVGNAVILSRTNSIVSNLLLVNTINRPFTIKIINHGEVRMGSPFNSCEIRLIGFDKAQIPQHGWQDKYAWSNDSRNLVLIKWDFEKNEPGFHFFIIDTTTGAIIESAKIFGLINTIAIEGSKIRYNKFLLDKTKSKPGELCCNEDDEYHFP